MRQHSTLLALAALTSSAAAFQRVAREERWTPPQETAALARGNQEDLDFAGFSPRPTEAPQHVGRMQLFPRLEGYSLPAGTCGFIESDGRGYTCRESTAVCSRSGQWEGCCEPNKSCSIMKTTCINYSASVAGSCNLPDDFHTLCCASSSAPACYTWLISSTASDGGSDETFTILGCGTTAGTGVLVDYDPEWSKTHKFESKPSTSRGPSTTTASGTGTGTATTSSAAATTTQPEKDDDTPVGAIAGGVVGGVAALALLGLVGFLFWRRKKKNTAAAAGTPQTTAASTTQSPPPNMSQMNSTPSPQTFAPVTPVVGGGSTYPQSTVSPTTSTYQPQGYDPRMSYQQGAYTPQPGYGQYPPQQGFDQQQGNFQQQGYDQQQQGYDQQQQGYDQQQQGYNNMGGYAPTHTTASPPPQFSPSPGAPEGQQVPPAHHQQQHQQPAMELPANNPVGHETNRAELS